MKGSTQMDAYVERGGLGTRGTVPDSVHFQTDAERLAELKARAASYPPESTARQQLEQVIFEYERTQ